MDDERVTNDEAKVDEVVPEQGAELVKTSAEVVKTPYDDFVEGVFTREIAKLEGAKPERMARVFQTVEDGDRVVQIAGDAKVVSELGDTMEKGGYRVREWHIKRPDNAAKEAEKVAPVLSEVVGQARGKLSAEQIEDIAQAVAGKVLLEAKREVLGEAEAVGESSEQLEEAVDKLAAEGSPFQQLGEGLQNEVKGGSGNGKE